MPSYSLSTQPTQLANLSTEQELSLRVLGAGTVLFSQSLSDNQNGVGISYIASDNVQKQKWAGELWATCDDPITKVQIIFPQSSNSATDFIYVPTSKNNVIKLLINGVHKQETTLCCKSLSLKSAFSKLIGRNVFKIILFALLARNLYSQVDVVITPAANQFTKVVVGQPWSTVANFRYIVTPSPSTAYFCTYIVNNNPTSSAALQLNSLGTGDVSTGVFLAKSGRWSALSMTNLATGQFSLQTINNLSVPASSTLIEQIQTSSSAHVVIYLSGTSGNAGSPDTVDIYAVATPIPCGVNQFFNSNGPITGVACDKIKSVVIANATTGKVLVGSATKQFYICAFSINVTDTPVQPASTNIGYGTGANCVSGFTGIWVTTYSAQQFSVPIGAGLGQLFSIPLGQDVCVVNTTGQTVWANMTYAQI